MPFIRRVGRPGLLGLAARTAVVAGTASAIGGAANRRQQARAEQEQAAAQQQAWEQQQAMEQAAAQAAANIQAQQGAPAAPAGGSTDIVARLQELGSLKQQGLLSDAEFEQAKAKLLGS